MNARCMNDQKMALLAGLAVAIAGGAVLGQPFISALAASRDPCSGTDTISTDDSGLTTFEKEGMKAMR
jgi:hypothetical protein